MYLVEFIVRKLFRPIAIAVVWTQVIFIPVLMVKIDLFNFLVNQGRCRSPLNACGQDGVMLAYLLTVIILAIFASIFTWLICEWDSPAWTAQRNVLKANRKKALPEVPATMPDIYTKERETVNQW